MKKPLSIKVFILLVFTCLAIYVADIDRKILSIAILACGASAIWSMWSDPPSSIITKYGGKEVEFHLYSGKRIKGQLAKSGNPRIIPGFVLVKDAYIIESDEEYAIAARSEDIQEEIHIDISQIDTIICEKSDKVIS
jgi:hypothetical protein